MKARSLIVLLILIASACVGAFSIGASLAGPMGAAETVRGMQSVAQGAPGTFVLQNGDTFLLAWPRGQQYAFTLLSSGGSTIAADLNALRTNTLDFASMVQRLQVAGWRLISPAQLPPAVVTTLSAYSVEAVIAGVVAMPNVVMVPVVVMTPSFHTNEVQQ
ncbi:MAG: hypothetical protein GYA58_03445 [Anaerolineaceae bacterium]|nr:hypothetical protein [Anaerolineaceae bacterium]